MKNHVTFLAKGSGQLYIAKKAYGVPEDHNYSIWMIFENLNTRGCDLLVKFILYSSTRFFLNEPTC